MFWALSPNARSPYPLSSSRKSDDFFYYDQTLVFAICVWPWLVNLVWLSFVEKQIGRAGEFSCLVHRCFWVFEVLHFVNEHGKDGFSPITSFLAAFWASNGISLQKVQLRFRHGQSMCLWISVLALRLLMVVVGMQCPHCIPTRRVIELFVSEIWCFGVCSTIGNLLSCDSCVGNFWCWCHGGSCCARLGPVKNPVIWFVWLVSHVTMWWVCDCRSK